MRTALERTWVHAGILLLVLLAGAVVALTVDLPSVGAVRAWLASTGAAGLVLLAAGLGLALIAPVPRTAVSVLAGLVAGFGLSRWLGRGAALRLAGARLARVDGLVGERGFVSLLTARLIPVLPFTLLSYAAGLTAVRLLPYLAATAVGTVPSTVVQVGAGASAPFIVRQATTLTVVPLLAAAVLLTAGGAVAWRRRARRRPVEPGPEPVSG